MHSSATELRPALADYLDAMTAFFDADLGLPVHTVQGPSYHSRMPVGAPVHDTRYSLDYCLGLLEEGSPESLARAERILHLVLPLQDRDPVSATYGVWPYFLEEPLERMSPPDQNWADFCGVRLAHLLARFPERISDFDRKAATAALHAAARAIFRRNVRAAYTNICFKGAVVCAAAAELTGDAFLADYARARLESFLAHTRANGGLIEYTSPTYTLIVLVEAERALHILRDEAVRALVEQVRVLCWDDIVVALHPATGQLCGPISRTYADWLTPPLAAEIRARLDVPIFAPATTAENSAPPAMPLYPVPALPCPAELRESLLARAPEHTSRRRYVYSPTEPKRERTATRWFGPDACLGSCNYENLWTQRRPILAYWRAGESVAMLKAGIRHDDDRDFASSAFRAAQEGRAVLAVASLVTDRGDFHDCLDRPADGVFHIANLHVAIELAGPGATISEPAPGIFALACAGWQGVVTPHAAVFDTHAIRWVASQYTDKAVLRAVVDDGTALDLNPAAVGEFAIAFSLTLEPTGSASAVPCTTVCEAGRILCRAGTLTVEAPLKPEAL